jgi:hypothetical protein
VVNVDYQEDVGYVQECDAGETCEYEDVKTIKCTVNGCEEVIPAVLESQDAIEADQGLILPKDPLRIEECNSNSAGCPSSPAITVLTDEAEAASVALIDGTVPTNTANSRATLLSTTSGTAPPVTDLPLAAASITVQEESQQQVQQPEMLESPLDTAVTTVKTDDIENNNAGAEDDDSSKLFAVATDNIGNEDDPVTSAVAEENQESARNTEDKSIDNNPGTSADDSATSGTSSLAPNNDNEENETDDTSSDDNDAGDSGDTDGIDNSNDSGDDNQDGSKDGENESDTDDTSSDDNDAGDSGDTDGIDSSNDSGD